VVVVLQEHRPAVCDLYHCSLLAEPSEGLLLYWQVIFCMLAHHGPNIVSIHSLGKVHSIQLFCIRLVYA